MSDAKTDLSGFSEEELVRELARRRATAVQGPFLAVEDAVEAAQARDGRATFDALLAARSQQLGDGPQPCPRCGRPVGVRARSRTRTVRTMAGEVTFVRHYHHCGHCHAGFYPLDLSLGLPEDGTLSPKMEARVLDFGVTEPFAQAAERWAVHHPAAISDHVIRATVDRLGRCAQAQPYEALQAQLRPPAPRPPDLLVVQNDGSMLPLRGAEPWKEAKVCVLYREDQHRARTADRRGLISEARYVAHLGGIETFRTHVDAALRLERADEAVRVAWVGDGAPCNWNLADEVCPRAIQILDWGHAIEHAVTAGKAVLAEAPALVPLWQRRIEQLLAEGRRTELFAELRACQGAAQGAARDALDALLRYYTDNADRMDYARYRAEGLPLGSGVVESAHGHVLQIRMKRSGQHWDPDHARRMVLLRAAYKTVGPLRFHRALSPRCLRQAPPGANTVVQS